MYIYIYVCINICTICIGTCMSLSLHIYIHMYMYMYMYMHMYAHIRAPVSKIQRKTPQQSWILESWIPPVQLVPVVPVCTGANARIQDTTPDMSDMLLP